MQNNGEFGTRSHRMIIISTIFLMIEILELFGIKEILPKAPAPPHIVCKWHTVMGIFKEMGLHCVCRAY
jgi:hypothetical protein